MTELASEWRNLLPRGNWDSLNGDGWRIQKEPTGAVVVRKSRRAMGISRILGIELPGPGQVLASAERTAIWQRPDQWLFLVPQAEAAALAQQFSMTLEGTGALAADLSDSIVRLVITGAKASEAIATGTRVALETDATSAIARFAGLKVTLVRTTGPSLHLMVDRAHELYLFNWFRAAAR